jgi:hypothetical protein
MNFERYKDPKESIQIGKMWNCKKVDSIHISVKDHHLPDTRLNERYPYSPDPRIITKKKLDRKETHNILKDLSDKTDFWNNIFNHFPDYKEDIISDKLQLSFFIVLEKSPDPSPLGKPAVSLQQALGKDFYYDGKIYSIPKRK